MLPQLTQKLDSAVYSLLNQILKRTKVITSKDKVWNNCSRIFLNLTSRHISQVKKEEIVEHRHGVKLRVEKHWSMDMCYNTLGQNHIMSTFECYKFS